MYNRSYLAGLLFVLIAGTIWGCVQVIYFNQINYISPVEIVAHRCIWAFFILLFFIIATNNFKNYILIFKNKKKIIYLSITGLLVSSNWFFFILAISINKVQDSSMGYFISPILSVAFGYLFFKEKLSKLQLLSLLLILLAILNLIINLGIIPWISLCIATSWSIYGLLRKKIMVSSEVGLLFETSLLTPFFILYLFFINYKGYGYFNFENINLVILLIGAGIITAIPLFFFNLGVILIPLSISGLAFYLVPTLQFLTSILYLNEKINLLKMFSFIVIWISIIIFIYESINKKYKQT